MGLILEVKGGRLAGKRIAVPEGKKVTIGRAPDRANFAVPHDSFMSSVHFAVECGPEGSRVKDRKSSNGTFLNGARITEAALNDGDEIRSGRTVFVARIAVEDQPAAAKPAAPVQPEAKAAPTVAPAAAKPPAPVVPAIVEPTPAAPNKPKTAPEPIPQPKPVTQPAAAMPKPPEPAAPKPAAVPAPAPIPASPMRPPAAAAAPAGPSLLTIGSWHFAKLPEHWEAQGEFGVQRAEKDAFPSNVVAAEEMLGLATLQRFVEAQVSMLRQYLREPTIEAALPPAIPGAEETVALDVRYATKDEQVIFLHRIYARHGKHVGVLTLTTLEKDIEETRPALDTILAGISFQPGE